MAETIKIHDYKKAIVKFNNGLGALLCNKCSKEMKRGFDHEDKEYYCSVACEPAKNVWGSPYGMCYDPSVDHDSQIYDSIYNSAKHSTVEDYLAPIKRFSPDEVLEFLRDSPTAWIMFV
jgi:hypothetical protein